VYASRWFAACLLNKLWTMVEIGYNLQENATLIFFVIARLMQGRSTRKGSAMKKNHLLMRFIAHLLSY
jgi:hypothetical protein